MAGKNKGKNQRRRRRRRANRTYKDRLFIRIFEHKEDLLSLYNAVNGSDYQNPDDGYMSLYEHQSTFNPNMPLRDCLYMLQIYQNYIDSQELDLYSSVLLKIPTPRLVVFYNGQEKMRNEEMCILRLSDSYERPEKEPALECRVQVINVNYGKNRDMMEKCPKLYEYSYLVAKIRENQASGKTLEGAISTALEDCLAQGYLTELLTTYKREVTGMLLYEYDERKHLKNTYEEGRQQKAYQAARNLYRRGFSIKDTAGILEEDEKMVAAWYKKWEMKRGR